MREKLGKGGYIRKQWKDNNEDEEEEIVQKKGNVQT